MQLVQKSETTTEMDRATVEELMTALTIFMAADSDAEALVQIDRDLQRAA